MIFDISKMLNPHVYDHPVQSIQLIETHISWVILTGDIAYKIKKPVNFGFLDFSTLQKRQRYCQQELRLNKRLTRNLYLDVVAITTQHNKLSLMKGEAIEYAIKMRQFPQSSQLDMMLQAGQLNVMHMEAIALMIADFHKQTNLADETSVYGKADSVIHPIRENFNQIKAQLDNTDYDEILSLLKHWNETTFEQLKPQLIIRKQQGYIRECHGDMHLRNLLWIGDPSKIEPDKGPMAFDCIEFNENLRWIDVINEIAFLVMDLDDRKQTQLANRFLNHYLEITGDYAGLGILPFYLCYRAMVRAKVAMLRLQQPDLSDIEKDQLSEEFTSYIDLAKSYSQETSAKLIVMRGVSASGKSTVSQQLVDSLGMIRLRSDVERKRSINYATNNEAPEAVNAGIYSEKVSEQTYAKLLELASLIIAAGYSVIIDATFLKRQQRKPFQKLAETQKIPYHIIETTASEEVLKDRIMKRKNDISDADLTVLEYQLSHWQPLSTDEQNFTLSINSQDQQGIDKIIKTIASN